MSPVAIPIGAPMLTPNEPPVSLWPDPDALGPVTDLYQLTMMAGYHVNRRDHERATFEMFVRKLPEGRAFLVFAGLEQAISDLLRLRFDAEQVAWLRRLPIFSHIPDAFFDRLTSLRFEGDVWAVPEGTIVFAGEPLLRVEAALPQAQWVETFLLASIGYPTLVASKAARIVEAAKGRRLYDFGLRRGQGAMAGMIAARSSFIAGFTGTSNVEAARRLGIPCSGTMAHSWVQSFETETEAFEAYSRAFPDATTLLVDTYDTIEGVRRAGAIEPRVTGIRIDSGDVLDFGRKARTILDEIARTTTKILASGDLEERAIAHMSEAGAPFDGYGIGTELVTSRDAPALSLVYKLVELEGKGRIKLSPGKKTYPLGKQVYRQFTESGKFLRDDVTRADETRDGEPLLQRVVQNGRLAIPYPTVKEIRERCREQLAALPDDLRGVDASGVYPLTYSDQLEAEAVRLGVKPPPE
ncbi:MAG: nicotinate phosphoribosyltransferase [Isosphaeraceae bacterium]